MSLKPGSSAKLEGRRSLSVEAENYQEGRRITVRVDGHVIDRLTLEEFRELQRLFQKVDA